MVSKKPALLGAAVVLALALVVGVIFAMGKDGSSPLAPASTSPQATAGAGESPSSSDSPAPSESSSPEPSDPSSSESPSDGPSTVDPGEEIELPSTEDPAAPIAEAKGLYYSNEAGGAVPYIPLACEVAHLFTDESPSDPAAYSAAIFKGDSEVASTDAATPVNADGKFRVSVSCDGLEEGETYRYAVSEKSGGYSFSEPFTYQVTSHPAKVSNTSKFVKGEWTNYVGQEAKIKFRKGKWEPGTRFWTQIWTSKGKNFTAADYEANTAGSAAIVRAQETKSPMLTWVPIERDRGRYVWISLLAQAPGKAPYLVTFEPELVR